jgi:hypothetical protein
VVVGASGQGGLRRRYLYLIMIRQRNRKEKEKTKSRASVGGIPGPQNILFRAKWSIFLLIGTERAQVFLSLFYFVPFNIHATNYQFNRQREDTGCGREIRKNNSYFMGCMLTQTFLLSFFAKTKTKHWAYSRVDGWVEGWSVGEFQLWNSMIPWLVQAALI